MSDETAKRNGLLRLFLLIGGLGLAKGILNYLPMSYGLPLAIAVIGAALYGIYRLRRTPEAAARDHSQT